MVVIDFEPSICVFTKVIANKTEIIVDPLSPELGALVDKIYSGRAILFVGAGFSDGTKNIKNNRPPMSTELSKEIARLGGFEEDDDLAFTSDYYIENCDIDNLIKHLKDQFTINYTEEAHKIICNAPWRRIYTTNYDNSIHYSALQKGKLIEAITIDKSPSNVLINSNICVHINGNIASLNAMSLKTSFKLSKSSYLSPDSFINSPWYYPFKKDIERCSAIVFVGYSLYDIDIQKILFENPELKAKTHFFVKPNPSTKEHFILSKYGDVHPIGLSALSEALTIGNEVPDNTEDGSWTEAFVEYTLSESNNDLTDKDILEFLMHGIIDDAHIANATTGIQNKPILINRLLVQTAAKYLKSNTCLIVCSELGNGKSIFCRELMSHLALNNQRAYYLQDGESDYVGDIDKLSKRPDNTVLIIENYEKFFDIFKYIASLQTRRLKVVLTSRTSNHERLRAQILEFDGIEPIEFSLDLLVQKEIDELVNIIDNIGYWGSDANLSYAQKKNFVSQKGQGQISHNLLNLFNSPHIRHRIDVLVQRVNQNDNYKKTLFAICILEVLSLPLSPSLISEVAGVDEIYKTSIRNDRDFSQLYRIDGIRIMSKSSLFSLHLLNYHFSSTFVIEMALLLVQKYDKLSHNGVHELTIYKSLLKFSFLEKILPDMNKKNSLMKYYDELKIILPKMKYEPQYWLQYGMAQITYKEYSSADKYFKQAYALANDNVRYDTSYIDNQQARLYLLQSLETEDHLMIYKYFSDADSILKNQSDDVYKFRQVALYKDFYDRNYKKISQKNKAKFEAACKHMYKALEHTQRTSAAIRIDHTTLNSCEDKLSYVLADIRANC